MNERVTAELRSGRIAVQTTYRDKEVVRQVPGARYSDPGDGTGVSWHVPLAWSSCLALRTSFGDRLWIGPELLEWSAAEHNSRIAPALAMRDAADWQGDPSDRPYQRVGAAFLRTARRATLADDMGTGKTRQVGRAIRDIGPDALPVLIVCPRAVVRHWKRELGMVAPLLRVGLVRGNITERRGILAQIRDGGLDVGVMTWAGLRSHSRLAPYGSVRLETCEKCSDESRKQTSCHRCPRELNMIDWGTIVADEAHFAKDPKSQQTRALWAVAHGLGGPHNGAAYRFATTGTPIADAVDDYWSIGHFLDEDEYPTRSRFVDRYALMSWNAFGGMDVVGIRAETRAEFDGFFNPRFLRRPKALVLPHLPVKTMIDREVELAPKQRKLYRQLADEMIGRLDSGDAILATNPLTLTGKLNRVAASMLDAETCETCDGAGVAVAGGDDACKRCGGWGRVFIAVEPSSKLDELEVLLDELQPNEQVVVFAESRQLIELAARRLASRKRPISHVLYTGTVSDIDREDALQSFMSGRARVFLATLGAGGTGLDGLQCASIAVFLQRSYSRIQNQQAEDRLHRSGQEGEKVLIIDIVSVDTIEDDKEIRLAEKEGRFQELVRDDETLRRLLTVRP